MKISLAKESDAVAWNQAVEELPEATFYHRFEWREVVRRHFRFSPLYLVAADNTGICGLLPLFFVRRALQPSVLLSMPLGVYGGAVAIDEQVRQQLIDAAISEAKKLSAGYIELRNQEFNRVIEADAWVADKGIVTFHCELAATDEEILKSILQKKRAEIRKAQGIGLEARFSRDIEPFYSVYATSMRNLGSPMFARRYYQSLIEIFAENCDLVTIYQGDQPLVSSLNFYFKDQVLPSYGGGYPAARQANASSFMYWELMRESRRRGYRLIDFGRSREGTGTYLFKRKFGFQPQPLHYQRLLLGAGSVPDINPDNPSLQRMISIWRRLPVALTRRLGPWVAQATV